MKIGTLELIDTMWFSNPTGQIGIILVEDEYDGLKCYIGNSDKGSFEADVTFIAEWGSTFPIPIDIIKKIFWIKSKSKNKNCHKDFLKDNNKYKEMLKE